MMASLQHQNSKKLSLITNSSCPNIQSKPQISLAPSVVSVIGVHIQKNKLKIKVGQSAELSASVLPVQATNQGLIWTNMNPDVITVYADDDKAIITGRNPGRAVMIVTTAEGKFRDLCVVHVQPYITNPN
ncbi:MULTISPECIES: Ig-like domain-containing protein [Bacillus]|uniref:Ig domain-containing protein n=1 Tax=Bacillus pseudomycoides TaxID=64104 RepID=A0AAJ2DIS4_9BACI|nr:Ig-like domain-containing protein [Bacillus pseudomycoides]MDR4324955.1 Ig domain-containing protein [Bacillus pseudomycoides]MED1535164.1 Ig domain-containing protein [Bacillus pseudomycoides]